MTMLCQFTTAGYFHLNVKKGGTDSLLFQTGPLQLNQWQHVSFTFSNSTLKSFFYLNGTLKNSITATAAPNNVLRTKNYIGKSNWGGPNVDAIYDEIKIFSVALTQPQIQKEIQNEFYLSNLAQESLLLSLVSTFTKTTGKFLLAFLKYSLHFRQRFVFVFHLKGNFYQTGYTKTPVKRPFTYYSTYLIEQYRFIKNELKCLCKCNQISSCQFVVFDVSQTCLLFKKAFSF